MPSTTTPGGEAGGSPTDGSGTDRAGPRRRSVLAGAAGVLSVGAGLAGCTGEGESPAGRRRRIDAARQLRRDAARDSETLLARYTSTAAAHPALGGRLAPLREAVARHLDALAGTRRDAGGGEKPGKDKERGARGHEPAPGGGPAAGNRMAVPGDEGRALAALADAERRTADARMRALVHAPPELARLLASVAAAGSTHAFLLTEETA